jgi:hypothetical protein
MAPSNCCLFLFFLTSLMTHCFSKCVV